MLTSLGKRLFHAQWIGACIESGSIRISQLQATVIGQGAIASDYDVRQSLLMLRPIDAMVESMDERFKNTWQPTG